jgi:hypothetical protein
VLHLGSGAVRGRGADQCGLAEPRRADPRQLGVRGRRDGAADPSNNVLFAVFLAIGAIFLVAFFLFIRARERAGKEALLSTGLYTPSGR